VAKNSMLSGSSLSTIAVIISSALLIQQPSADESGEAFQPAPSKLPYWHHPH
jgi:hypothetical protein